MIHGKARTPARFWENRPHNSPVPTRFPRNRAGVVTRGAFGFLVALLIAAVAVGATPRAAHAAAVTDAKKHVVIVGISGLLWSDLDRKNTPTLWRLAERGAIASLSVRAATRLTCQDDGWTTLGAGNRARGLAPLSGETCTPNLGIAEPTVAADGSATVSEHSALSRTNDKLSYGAEPGMLAASTGCVTAVGRGAALAAMHPGGYVNAYLPQLPADPAALLRRCPVTVVAGGEIDDTNRAADARRVDKQLAAVARALPASATLITAGVADVTQPAHLRPLIIDGPGYRKAWLTSASTRKDRYTQLIDVAPTVFDMLDVGTPKAVVGRPITVAGTREGSIATAIDGLVDDDKAATATRGWVQPFFAMLTLLNVGLMAAMGVFFYRRRRAVAEASRVPARAAEPEDRLSEPVEPAATTEPAEVDGEAVAPIPPTRFGWERVVEVAAVAVAALPVASFIAQLVPWWRAPAPIAVHAASLAAISAIITLVAYLGPWARWSLGPPLVVSTVTAVALGADVLTGSWMQLNSLAGYSPIVAGRFVGFGNLAFAVFAAAVLLSAAYFAQLLPPRRRAFFLITVAVVAVIIVGAPIWGSDVGGVIALTPAGIALAMRGAGLRLSTGKAAACAVAGLVVVSAFAWLDYARPVEDRTHLGRFVEQLFDGTAGTVVRRKAEANLNLLLGSQLTLLVIAVILFVVLVAWRRGAGLRRVLGIYPCVRAGLIAVLFAAGFGFVVNDSGVAIPAFMALLTVPLLIATTLRVLRP